MKYSLLVALSFSLAGCAAGGLDHWASDPVRIGPDTFRVVAVNGGPDVLNVAYRKASATCASLGRQMLLLDSGSNKASGYDITFRCLTQGDQEFKRNLPTRPADIQVDVIKR